MLKAKLLAARLLTNSALDKILTNRSVPFAFNPKIRISLEGSGCPTGTAATILVGQFEPSERRAIARFMPADLPTVELGAGIGAISSLIAHGIRQGPLILVEANKGLIPILEENSKRNNLNGVAVTVVNAALSDRTGVTDFNRSFDSHLGSKVVSPAAPERIQSGTLESVRTVTLGSLTTDFENFALVCDIEGAEAAFIVNDDEALGRCKWLCIELHDTMWDGIEYSVTSLDAIIQRRGFRLLHRDGSVFVYSRER